jgi:hypothetical protein
MPVHVAIASTSPQPPEKTTPPRKTPRFKGPENMAAFSATAAGAAAAAAAAATATIYHTLRALPSSSLPLG